MPYGQNDRGTIPPWAQGNYPPQQGGDYPPQGGGYPGGGGGYPPQWGGGGGQQGGFGPYGPTYSQGGTYNPFDPQNLYAPMSNQIDENTEAELAKINESFGAQGLAWSSPLLQAHAGARRSAAQDKTRLLSDLMYKGATDMYGRQQNSAQMAMQLGQMQDGRDSGMLQDMLKMAMSEQQVGQGMAEQQYQDWLRRQEWTPKMLSMFMGKGGDWFYDRPKDKTDDWAEWAKVLGSLYNGYNSGGK